MTTFSNLRRRYVIAAMIAVLCLGRLATGQSRNEHITVPLSDPSRPAVVKVELVNGGITVHDFDGKAVIIEVHVRSNNTAAREDGVAHAGPTPNDLSVSEENNRVKITSYTMERTIDLTIAVPHRTSLVLNAVNRGAVIVSGVEGELEANNVNGAVTMRDVSGNVIAHSLNAPVLVNFRKVDLQKPMAFSSMNGTIDVTFPADFKANLSLQSGQGKIYSDFDIQPQEGSSHPITEEGDGKEGRYRINTEKTVYGTINGGGPQIQFKNFNGNIYIRKAGVPK